MKKWFGRIALILLVLLIGLIVVADILQDYPEKFKINGVDVSLFKVTGKNMAGCYVLSDSISKNDTNSVFLIGIRFKLDYLSVKREHLWNDTHSPYGALGHIDTIRAINLFDNANKMTYNDSLTIAKDYEDFYKYNIDTREGHHGNQTGCYVAQIFKGLKEFINYYNTNANTYNMVSQGMNDYHLFKANYDLARLVVNNKVKLSIAFTDGRVIEQNINYTLFGNVSK